MLRFGAGSDLPALLFSFGSVGSRLRSSKIFGGGIGKGESKTKIASKIKARREAGFIRNNLKIIAQNIFLATPNSNFARDRSFGSRTRCFQFENGIFGVEIADSRMIERTRFNPDQINRFKLDASRFLWNFGAAFQVDNTNHRKSYVSRPSGGLL